LTNRSFVFKIVLIGDGGVGKTTLRFMTLLTEKATTTYLVGLRKC